MHRFVCTFLAVGMVGCFGTRRSNTSSAWIALKKAEDVDCHLWPLREKDLQVSEVMYAGQGGGFFVRGVGRNGREIQYYAPFKGDVQLDTESFVTLSLGPRPILLGGVSDGARMLAIIARNNNQKSTLEVRGVPDNVVRQSIALGPWRLEEGAVIASRGGAWMRLRGEDGDYRIAHMTFGRGKEVNVRVLPLTIKALEMRLLTSGSQAGGALALWRESGDTLRAQWLPEVGAPGATATLAVALDHGIESWSAYTHGGTYFLAVVDGDSLIGQSTLKVSRFIWNDGNPSLHALGQVTLRDEHVTEPVFMASSSGLEVLILKWVDEESSIARYKVGGKIENPQYSGIFPKGSRIFEAFSAKGDSFAVVRSRGENTWTFRICEL